MKNKHILISSVALIVVVMITIFIYNSNKKNVNSDNTEFANYITAYTSGTISKTAPVRIKLTSEIADKLLQNKDLVKDIIKFSPAVEGEAKLNGNYLEFTPKKELKQGTKYYAEFNLGKIKKDVPKDLLSFNFEFNTIKQDIDFVIDEQKTTDTKSLKYQRIKGTVMTADVENKDKIAQVFSAKQGSKKLAIKWEEMDGGLSYHFTIDSIERLDDNSEVVLNYNGSIINAPESGSNKITIPAKGNFELLSTNVIQSPEQYLKLQFSDPLDEMQDLSGLIKIKGQNNLKYLIDGNIIKVYTDNRLNSDKLVTIYRGIKNVLGYELKNDTKITETFESIKPAVKLVGKGNILPSSKQGLLLPFEAVNLKAVAITVVKIYEDNVLQFLQNNDIEGKYQLRRVAKPILRKVLKLDQFGINNFAKWNKFTLDLSKLIKTEPGAIYRVEIGFRKEHSLYACDDNDDSDDANMTETTDNWSDEGNETSSWDNYENYYETGWYSGYWRDRDNPCKRAYYSKNKMVGRNIIASDLGVIAKKGKDNEAKVFVTDMLTTKPQKGITVEFYDYQQQKISSSKTDRNGVASAKNAKELYFVVAKNGKQRGYLKMSGGNSLSLSRFNTTGTNVKKGLKGFIYGERGVWRPGDSLFLTFVLKEEAKPLPKKHPIVFEFKNPQGQLIKKVVKTKKESGFYSFIAATEQDAPTGNYNLTVSVGAVKFSKSIKIETIKPNRLKIKLDFNQKILKENEEITGKMNVKWLHGAIAAGLNVKVDLTLKPVKTTFNKYNDFSFDDPLKHFYANTDKIFDGTTDDSGNVDITTDINTNKKSSGKLNATFVTKVFEKGGNFSIDQYTVPFSPYSGYVGVKLPKGDKRRGMLLTDKDHKVEFITLDSEGKMISKSHKLKVMFVKLKWRWWWDQSSNSVSSYNFRKSSKLLSKAELTTSGGKADWSIKVKYPDWGRYMVFVYDEVTGHSAGKIVYIDWPGWAGRAQKGDTQGASMLMFDSDKKKYNVGEDATITIPTGTASRALVSIENGTKIIKTDWLETKKGETTYKFKCTKDMTPNVYVHVTLLQKHAQTANDLPIRMYGVVPIMVENPETHLHPVIKMPDVLEAEKNVSITVSEKDNKPMTYTLAVVDEGLLDLTRFKTPNPWNEFYKKEALGVKTWDIYNDVIGAYSGKLERLMAIGGDGSVEGKKNKKANRFKPVVKFFGPFTLKKGSKTHTFKMPQYIGSVRTMVITGKDKAYGSAEKATQVIKPLMLLATLPRVLGPKEKVKLPVSIFAMKEGIKNVTVKVKTDKYVKVTGSKSKRVSFAKPGEKDVTFDLEVLAKTGISKIQVVATAAGKTATYNVEIDVRNPNHETTDVLAEVLQKGNTWKSDFKPVGMDGTNKAVLEISSIPPINLKSRLDYLIRYPHGCIEQTTSSVFPQLYVSNLIELTKKQKSEIQSNVKAAIKKIQNFQVSDGGFAYWQNGYSANLWGTNYAGHFLLEAKAAGYSVPSNLLSKWKSYQVRKARRWRNKGGNSQLVQAYRLYTLALAGSPQKGAMNRLKATKNLSNQAKWRLAAAYYMAGKKSTAKSMATGLSMVVSIYKELAGTYGSDIRDKAMMLETLTLLDKKKQGFSIVKEISESLSSKKFMSTQTTAYSLLAISKYIKNNKSGGMKYSYSVNGKNMTKISDNKSVSQQTIPITSLNSGQIEVKNNGNGIIYARLILQGIPDVGVADNKEHDLNMSIKYMLTDGSSIDPTNIKQGTDFVAEVKITNPGSSRNYKEMALTQVFPSGWEIINTRLVSVGYGKSANTPKYQDVRDDRVFTYFDLNKKRTKTFRVILNASYAGEFWMPPVYCEAMYDATINSRKGGKFVKVTKM